ncbi:MAG: glycosyltransferase family 2 protein [Thermoleophilia bacterium]
MQLSIVVTTLGERPAEIIRLLDSIVEEQVDGLELIVVDQSATGAALRVARAHPVASAMPVVGITSERGASAGRNAGLRMSTGQLVTFPDDDAWYPPRGLTTLLRRMEEDQQISALVFVARGSDGQISSTTPPRRAGPVSRRLASRLGFESAMVFRIDSLRAVRGFAQEMGPGSGTPWGAGEGLDLLLRMLATGANMRFDPSLFIHHEDPDLTDEAWLARVRSYSRGEGYGVARNHCLSLYLYRFVLRPALGVASAIVLRQTDKRRIRTARISGHIHGMIDGLPARTSSRHATGAGP